MIETKTMGLLGLSAFWFQRRHAIQTSNGWGGWGRVENLLLSFKAGNRKLEIIMNIDGQFFTVGY